MKGKIISILSYLAIMAITVFAGSWVISFLVNKNQEHKTCTKINPELCKQSECVNIGYYWWGNACNLTTEEESKSSEFPDYNFYLGMKNHFELISTTTPSYVKEADKITDEEKEIKWFVKQNGKIAGGYLFIDVSVNDLNNDSVSKSALTVWDSVYVSLQGIINNYKYNPVSNGHLFRPKSLNVPESQTTRLLYDLRQIPFTTIPYSDKNDYKYQDWLKFLNNDYGFDEKQNNVVFEFKTFLSTLKSGGVINKIIIGYECEDVTPDCNLEFIKK